MNDLKGLSILFQGHFICCRHVGNTYSYNLKNLQAKNPSMECWWPCATVPISHRDKMLPHAYLLACEERNHCRLPLACWIPQANRNKKPIKPSHIQ